MVPFFSLPGPALPLTTKSSNQSCHGFASAAENVILRFGISSVVGCFVLIPDAPSTNSSDGLLDRERIDRRHALARRPRGR